MRDFICAIVAAWKYRDYLPQPLTMRGVLRWIRQFDHNDRKPICELLGHVIYLPEKTVRQILIEQNAALMQRLIDAGLQPHQIIYMQVHDPGSSSPVMLNILRDAAHLDTRGCSFLDARNERGIADLTNDLAEGAIIYVDDFIGSGEQLGDERDFAMQFAVGNFVEFALVPSICEEGLIALEQRGIEVFAGHVHKKAERPLHNDSTILDLSTRDRLRTICNNIDGQIALGHRNMAVMVVLYRNAPDNVPVLLRGNAHQTPYVGVFPRTTDLPIQ
jgi:hypothetical protein